MGDVGKAVYSLVWALWKMLNESSCCNLDHFARLLLHKVIYTRWRFYTLSIFIRLS